MEGGDNGFNDCNTNCTYRPGLRSLGGLGGGTPKHTPHCRQQEEDLKLNMGQ